MQDLTIALRQERNTLKELIRDLQTRAKKKSESERKYRVAKAAYTRMERAEGTPVTIIADLVAGNPEIAELKKIRDDEEMMYEACQQAIYATKLEINVIMQLISMEYNIPQQN